MAQDGTGKPADAGLRRRLAQGDAKARREFSNLRRRWYGIAQKSGFKDIESDLPGTDEPGPLLSGGPSSGDLARGLYRAEREDYYRWARALVHELSGMEQAVWEGHSEGKSVRAIQEALPRCYQPLRREVPGMISRIRDRMKARGDEVHPSSGSPESDIYETMLEDMHPPGVEILERGTVNRKK